jgi:hypothetical protein
MIRGRLIMAGIPDPLRQLPDMHALLDVVEVIITEHMSPEQLDTYYERTYSYTTPDRVRNAEPGPDTAVPPEFSVAEQRSSFSNFARLAGGLE